MGNLIVLIREILLKEKILTNNNINNLKIVLCRTQIRIIQPR